MRHIEFKGVAPNDVEYSKDASATFLNPPEPAQFFSAPVISFRQKATRFFHITIILGIGVTFILLRKIYEILRYFKRGAK